MKCFVKVAGVEMDEVGRTLAQQLLNQSEQQPPQHSPWQQEKVRTIRRGSKLLCRREVITRQSILKADLTTV